MLAARLAVLAVAGVVALTATGVRIGDHAGYVRVVVDFNGNVPMSQVWFDNLTGTMATLHIAHPGIKTQTTGNSGEGVHVALQPGTQALHIAASFAKHRFKYVEYSVPRENRLAIDLWKSAPPPPSGGPVSGRNGCLTLGSWHVSRGTVKAKGSAGDLFEHTFQVVIRGANGTVLGRRTVQANGNWSQSVPYHATRQQAGTLEAVALSAKDGSLACLAQVRVTIPAS